MALVLLGVTEGHTGRDVLGGGKIYVGLLPSEGRGAVESSTLCPPLHVGWPPQGLWWQLRVTEVRLLSVLALTVHPQIHHSPFPPLLWTAGEPTSRLHCLGPLLAAFWLAQPKGAYWGVGKGRD